MNMKISLSVVVALVGVICWFPHPATSHGRLYWPPGRSSVWRFAEGQPRNYNDHELFCGGREYQIQRGYQCGVCGDPVDGEKKNEAGGIYANGVILQNYTQGQRAKFTADITANHLGFMEFKLCPVQDKNEKATKKCLNDHPVQIADGSGTKYYIGRRVGKIEVEVILPADLTCNQCVLQWRYHTGNSHGVDENGRHCLGCGYQEEFYSCADIRIFPHGHVIIDNGSTAPRSTLAPTNQGGSGHGHGQEGHGGPNGHGSHGSGTWVSASGQPAVTNKTSRKNCKGANNRTSLDEWCVQNCGPEGSCPSSHCTCEGDKPGRVCRGTGLWANDQAMHTWCVNNCAQGHCPSSMCKCNP